MWPFSRLAGLFRRSTREQRTTVTVDHEAVRCIRPDGRGDTVAWYELRSVTVETNDCGPFVEDVYFRLEGPDSAFSVPQCAAGIDALTKHLFALPGFDSAAFIQAMGCTVVARIECWQRPPDGV